MKKVLIISVIFLLSFFLLAYRITEVPPGINGDEAGVGYNAILISRNLTDENNNFLPLFIFAKGSDWKQPVTVYTTALVFKFFGVSFATLRMTSILFVIASIVLLYFISKAIFDLKFFMISSLVLLTTPIIMIQSHLALENVAPLPFILFWLLMLAKFEKSKKLIYLLFGGMSLGTGIFSYLGMRLVVPVLTLITLIYFRKRLKEGISFLSGALPFFALLYISGFYYPGAAVGHFSAPIPSVDDFLLRYLSIFDLSFLFLKGDVTSYHSTGKAGMFLVSSLPLFLIGVGRVLKDKKRFEILILSSFFLTPLLFGFVPEVYRASRLLALIPFYVIISTIGFLALPKKLGVIIIILMAINYWNFTHDYWFKYPERVREVFPIPIERTYEFHIKQ